jgi:hypothetical protein
MYEIIGKIVTFLGKWSLTILQYTVASWTLMPLFATVVTLHAVANGEKITGDDVEDFLGWWLYPAILR